MAQEIVHSTTTISVFTRHAADCPQTNPQWKRCRCRKSLYIYEDGKVRYKSAKTRSWEQAERVAQAERDLRNPVMIQLREIEAQKAAAAERASELEANQVTIEVALDRWLKSHKKLSGSSESAYRVVARKFRDWSVLRGPKYLAEITPEMLDEWVGQWSPSAARKDDRMGITTQSHLLSRLKSFFSWATKIRLIDMDPSLPLTSITPSDKRTMPLTPTQFEELLAATERYDAAQSRQQDKFGKELRTLFLVMRWSGLRIADALMLPKAALVGNRLTLTTRKTRASATPVLPDQVVAELLELRPGPNTNPCYFWWTGKSNNLSLTSFWTARVRELNKYLSFVDEQGQPMKFHSHQLRDTFAVELLLAGVAIEDVSHLLTHKSVRVTERYYAPWVTAPFETTDGERLPRERGTPQGGVVSPILMNLFMHYTFDAWMKRTNPSCPFARYADDAVVHCHTRKQAEEVMRSIALRLAECGLTMHPEKSKVVYCKDSNRTASYPHVSFTFLGFTFRPRKAIDRQKRAFTNFLPGVSADALKRMRKKVRGAFIVRRREHSSNWRSNTIPRYEAGGITSRHSVVRRCTGSFNTSIRSLSSRPDASTKRCRVTRSAVRAGSAG
jgi:site-specific recombinase XerD